MTPQRDQLRKKLAEYTSGKLSLADFREWFAPVLRDAHKADSETEKLAHAVEWEFCDLTRRVSSELTMKENLSRLARVALSDPPQAAVLGVQVATLVFLLDETEVPQVLPGTVSFSSQYESTHTLQVHAGVLARGWESENESSVELALTA